MMSTLKPVVFTLEDEVYGIDINMVNAIEKTQKVMPVPNSPNYIKGIINLRGEVIPVYDIRNKFGLSRKDSDASKLIITKTNGMLVAIEVDEVREIHDISEEDISDAPEIVISKETSYISKIAKFEDRMIIILNADKLVTKEEALGVREITENK